MVRARRILAMAAASAVALAGSRGRPRPRPGHVRRQCHGDARLRAYRDRLRHQDEGPRVRDGDADARALVPGADTLRRRFRRVDRRARGTRRTSTGSTTSTASRRLRARPRPPSTRGDRIWWDLHDWSATDSVPAVVGSFPEPFVRGINGKRFPTTVECATDVAPACKQASAALDAAGSRSRANCSARARVRTRSACVVGTWNDIKGDARRPA